MAATWTWTVAQRVAHSWDDNGDHENEFKRCSSHWSYTITVLKGELHQFYTLNSPVRFSGLALEAVLNKMKRLGYNTSTAV